MARSDTEHLIRQALVVLPAAGLAVGGIAWLSGDSAPAAIIWGAATLPVAAALAVEIVVSLRRAEVGLDVVALLAMVSALILGETLAGCVVALMYAGGQFLESYAAGRARREMTALLERAPKTAMRYAKGGDLAEVPIDDICIGDRVLVRGGEVVPADGTIAGDKAVLDQSALTGEAMPVTLVTGEAAMSGSTNAGMAFDLVATRPAAESTYAGIVRLVEAAGQDKAPIVRLADRFAIVFLAVTVAVAGGAWIASSDPLRWLAVMVVATPCPLILALPVAIIAGVSRAASRGVLVKGGGAMEVLAEVRTIVVDKTGTLTHGHASLAAIHAAPGYEEEDLLRLAASLDQASSHVIAQALVAAAHARHLPLSPPSDVREAQGSGLQGWVDGREITVGGFSYVQDRSRDGHDFGASARREGAVGVAVAVDGVMAGLIVLSDEIRPEVPAALAAFRRLGVRRFVLASGDRADVTAAVASQLDIDTVLGEMTPQAKVMAVVAERDNGPVMMVGDGVNDAPALAAADIGVAMGAHGAVASAQAADAILLVDRIDRLAEAMAIAQRSRRIALQSVVAGIGLSMIAMVFAAFGYLPPVTGALLQEAIDVAVILNALRALRG
ncbi:heavy metal translocating P-type ATPase [Bauldia litoralis]|uniref:P-type Zn(2+) transporter n=1 Tax=Bauldia litoralis TaxID=665467 RepID=A0A1G6EG58_9HYPH|nr:heavy metal translocating P-type ATPase [Bauldia litoralis]SDB56459.1 ATPase, P-type (transporting), HAD superfamily, subfamily IC/heavy metal translocating P-type ATPase [Bauldia litoralis]